MYSLPNLLTISRIAVIPVILILMAFPGSGLAAWSAWAIFTIACITDFFDGYLARKYKDISPLGTFLDPIADKLLISALLIMLAFTDRVPGWAIPAGILILAREIFISVLREFLAGQKSISVPVSRLAKWKTVVQMIALGTLMVGVHGPYMDYGWVMVGAAALWLAAAITLITGWDYLKASLSHLQAPPKA